VRVGDPPTDLDGVQVLLEIPLGVPGKRTTVIIFAEVVA
jgi:hypothetical protein